MEDLAITLQFFLNCVTKVVGRFGSLLLNLWFDLQMLLDLERRAKTYKFVFYKKNSIFFSKFQVIKARKTPNRNYFLSFFKPKLLEILRENQVFFIKDEFVRSKYIFLTSSLALRAEDVINNSTFVIMVMVG